MTDRNPSGGSPIFAFLIIAIAFAAMLLAGCTVGPNYARPAMDLPKQYGVDQASAIIEISMRCNSIGRVRVS